MSAREDRPGDRSYLGEEFLTWLWYHCETAGGSFVLHDEHGREREVGLLFDDYLLLKADERIAAEAGLSDENLFESVESILRRGSPARTAEAGVALLRGKKLVQARLLISDGDREWSLILDGTQMCYRSIKLPRPDSEDEREREMEICASLFTLAAILDDIYALFLERRLGPAFRERVIPAMGEWILEKAGLV